MDPRKTPSVLRGAVDLSALRERAGAGKAGAATAGAATANAAPAPPGSPPTATTSPTSPPGASAGADDNGRGSTDQSARTAGGVTIIDVSEATFQSEVLERSLTTPVVIDFWASWCGPCRQLSPVLEKLAVEGAGTWVLAKIDVDANPRIAQAFRVQGIPMVFAVVGGQPIDAFTGVVPEAQLRQWLDAVVAAAGGAVDVAEDPALVAAEDAMLAGRLDEAEHAYKKILSDRPADPVAQAGLTQVAMLRRVNGVDPTSAVAAADGAPDDLEAQTLAADVEMLSGQAERAYARLVQLVRRSQGDVRDRAREHLVSLFALAAPDDPAVVAARRALASALF